MKTNKLIYPIFLTLIALNSFAGESLIPLQKDQRLPSDDLILNGKKLTLKEARELKNIDLSTLDPKLNEIYDGSNNLNFESKINVGANSELSFQGSILSNTGLLRFNAINSQSGKVLTVHLDKSLHSILLRKNLLSRLGYKLPEMKYLKNITVTFNTVEEKKNFLDRTIPENTLGDSSRWVIEESDLKMTLQDVLITEPNEADFYNLALGVPTQSINSRTIRGLAEAYALVDLKESVNQFSWNTGRIDNKAILLSHFTNNEFNSSIDDVVWMQNKINKLTRKDIEEIVKLSFYPDGIRELLVEKIIERRNSLNKVLNIKSDLIPTNKSYSYSTVVVNGKVQNVKFNGYASRFSYGDSSTPLDQMQYFIYSKLESNSIDNAISKINQKLELYDVSGKRNEYFKNQFQTGLQHFVQTGEMLPIEVGTWSSPIFNFNLITKRDIVIGNYLGTENLVQLADTFGAGVRLGAIVGIEGLPSGAAASIKGAVSIVRTYTHLKPVKSLKDSIKEPFKNIFVSLLKENLREDFFNLSELEKNKSATEEKAKKISEILKKIDAKLGTGESLILTDRIMPSAEVEANLSSGLLGLGTGISGSVATIKRIHFYKKAPSILQIFNDKGFLRSIDLSMNLNASGVPVLTLNTTKDNGKYQVRSYMVNLSENIEENPNLYKSALGVYQILKDKDFEILNTVSKPVDLETQFKDSSTGISFLLWRMSKNKGVSFYDIEAKDGVKGKFFSYQKDYLTGINFETFSKKLVNYYLENKTQSEVTISDDPAHNPGETIFGSAKVETSRFEAAMDENGQMQNRFLTLYKIKQGWNMNQQDLIKNIQLINSKFGFDLFSEGSIDFTKLKLFKIGYHLNLYERGIDRLVNISLSEVESLERQYKLEANCASDNTAKSTIYCGDLRALKSKLIECKKTNDSSELAICLTSFAEVIFNNLKFKDFKSLLGENNFYLYGSIDGLRKGSEILNDSIYSNSIGKIGSEYVNGPLEVVRGLIGISEGEFSGGWFRSGI